MFSTNLIKGERVMTATTVKVEDPNKGYSQFSLDMTQQWVQRLSLRAGFETKYKAIAASGERFLKLKTDYLKELHNRLHKVVDFRSDPEDFKMLEVFLLSKSNPPPPVSDLLKEVSPISTSSQIQAGSSFGPNSSLKLHYLALAFFALVMEASNLSPVLFYIGIAGLALTVSHAVIYHQGISLFMQDLRELATDISNYAKSFYGSRSLPEISKT